MILIIVLSRFIFHVLPKKAPNPRYQSLTSEICKQMGSCDECFAWGHAYCSNLVFIEMMFCLFLFVICFFFSFSFFFFFKHIWILRHHPAA